MNTPNPGQIVFTYYFSFNRDGKPRARISKREYYRATVPGWATDGKTYWVLGPIGKRADEATRAPYGMACRPEMVFESEMEAKAALLLAIDAKVAELGNLRFEFNLLVNTL